MDNLKNLGIGGLLGIVYGFFLCFAVMSLNRECFRGKSDDSFFSTASYIIGALCFVGATLGYKWNEPTTKAVPEITGIEDGIMLAVSMSGVVLNFNKECIENGVPTFMLMFSSLVLTGGVIGHCWKRAPQRAAQVLNQYGIPGADFSEPDLAG